MNIFHIKTTLENKYKEYSAYFRKAILTILRIINDEYFSSARWLITTREKLKDLKATNYELGIFHLQNGNLNDAIFRFKFIDKLLTAGHFESKFMLGWCYLLKGDVKSASMYLTSSETSGAKELLQFLAASNLTEIPYNLLNQYYDLWADKIEENTLKKEIDILDNFFNFLNKTIESLPDNISILEIGCKTGIVGEKLALSMQKSYRLEGVELSQRMCRIARTRNYSKSSFYEKVHCSQIADFINHNDNKFDLVIAYNSLNIYKNFSLLLKQLKKEMPAGIVAICLKENTPNGVNLDREKFNFVYDVGAIEAELKNAGYTIAAINNFQSNNSEKYYMVICTNKQKEK